MAGYWYGGGSRSRRVREGEGDQRQWLTEPKRRNAPNGTQRGEAERGGAERGGAEHNRNENGPKRTDFGLDNFTWDSTVPILLLTTHTLNTSF